MSKKTILFIFTGIIIIASIAFLVMFLNSKKSKEAVQDKDEKMNQDIPPLPESQIAEAPDLFQIQKNVHEEISNVQEKSAQISEKTYENTSGQVISLNDFAKANKLKIETGVLQNSSQKNYLTFSCAVGTGERPAVGIVLQLRRDVPADKYNNLYPKMESDMENWEKTIFGDLAPLFFPGESFDKEPLFSKVEYTTSNKVNIVEIHYANLVSVSRKQYSIDWGFLNDQIYISNNKDCLRRELDKNADAYEP